MAKVDLTPAKLADLRQKAEAAEGVAPSPWTFSHTSEEYRFFYEVRDSGDYQVVYDMSVEEGEHIAAADPATVLALVEEIERFRHFVRETLDELHECYNEEGCKICKEIDRVIESEAGQ